MRGLVMLVVFAAASAAHAQGDDSPTQHASQDEEARSVFEAGRVAFDAGRFEDALEYFQRAHELSGRADLLFNVGTTLDRLRRDQEALDAFEAYVEARPDATNRSQVDARMAILRESVRSAASEPATEERGRLWTWVTAGAAVAFGGAAIGLWLAAGSQFDDLKASCGETGCSDEEIDDSNVAMFDKLTTASLVLSLAFTAGAITLFFVEPRSAQDSSVRLQLGPGSALLRGTF